MKRILLLGLELVAFAALAEDYEPPGYASPDLGSESTITQPGANPCRPHGYTSPGSDLDGTTSQAGAVLVTPDGDGGLRGNGAGGEALRR
jgi:hypothetical protein